MPRRHLLAGGALVALSAIAVAWFAPQAAFVWFRGHVIGHPDPRTEPFELVATHRGLAVLGGLVAACALVVLATRKARPVACSPPRRLVFAAVPFAALVFYNARYAGVTLGLWDWFGSSLHLFYFPIFGAFAVAMIALTALALRDTPRRELGQPALGAALGAGYGAFSSLWHCCAPLWQIDLGLGAGWPLALAGAAILSVALAGFTVDAGARFRAPMGELAGAVVLACGYPWHTPLWFVKCLVGGAFFVALARRAGVLAPACFLFAAFVTHMTLPFLI